MKLYLSDWVNIACVFLMLYLAITVKLEIYFLKQQIENSECLIRENNNE